MLFIIVVAALWLLYVFLLYRFNRAGFSLPAALLPLLLFSLLLAADLGVNYLAAASPALNDGIGRHGVFAPLLFGSSGWSLPLFRQYYHGSALAFCALLIVYMVLTITNRKNRNK